MSSIKDNLLRMGLKPIINSYISDFGNVIDLDLDSKRKQLNLMIELTGEETPLEVRILKYEIEKEGDNNYLVVKDIDFSREWINIVLKKYGHDMRFPVPTIARHLL